MEGRQSEPKIPPSCSSCGRIPPDPGKEAWHLARFAQSGWQTTLRGRSLCTDCILYLRARRGDDQESPPEAPLTPDEARAETLNLFDFE